MRTREGNIRWYRYKNGSSSYTVDHTERHCKFLTKNSEVPAFRERRWFFSEKNEMEVWEVFQTSRRRERWKKRSYVEINVRVANSINFQIRILEITVYQNVLLN